MEHEILNAIDYLARDEGERAPANESLTMKGIQVHVLQSTALTNLSDALARPAEKKKQIMKSKKRFASCKFGANTLFLLVMSLLLVACAQPIIPVPSLSESTLENVAKLPNPAAVFCEDQGYTYEIRTDADGNQYGVCIFPDGSECDGWAYYRGECTQEQVEATEKIAINIVDEAGLVQTRKITVHQLDPNALTSQKPMISITEPEIVAEIVASLNTDVYLIPRARCPAPFTLRFHLTDGAIQEIGYACELQTPSFLRGGQDFWQGKDVLAPDGFNALLCSHLTRKIKNTLDVFDWSSKLPATAIYGDVETQIEEAINQLQAAYGPKRSDVTVLGVEKVVFQDTSLGVPEPGRTCYPASICGYIIELEAHGVLYTFHGSGDRVVGIAVDDSQAKVISDAPVVVVQQFYDWYLDYVRNVGNPLMDKAYHESPYLSPTFVSHVDEIIASFERGGYDPFLMAQDIPFAVQVNEPVYDETGASVVVQCNWFGQELPATLTVQLAEEDGVWRITNIIRTKATPPKAPLRTSSSVLPTIFISNHL